MFAHLYVVNIILRSAKPKILKILTNPRLIDLMAIFSFCVLLFVDEQM